MIKVNFWKKETIVKKAKEFALTFNKITFKHTENPLTFETTIEASVPPGEILYRTPDEIKAVFYPSQSCRAIVSHESMIHLKTIEEVLEKRLEKQVKIHVEKELFAMRDKNTLSAEFVENLVRNERE